jgi:hypothetical protein
MKTKFIFILLTLFLSIGLFSQPTSYIGFWPFNGDLTDISGNNIAGSINGDVVYVPGKFDQAISLNGNGYVYMDNISTLNIANSEFSISVWLKTTSDTARQCILNKLYTATGYHTVGGYMLETGFTDGNIRFQLGVSAPNMVDIDVPANFYDNEWHHIAITRSADIVKLFFDGSLIGSSSCAGMNFSNTSAPFSVGYFLQKEGHYFHGAIDDLKIISQVFSDSEVTALYNDDGMNIWKKNGNNIYFNEGYVGIGTPTPSSCLDIVTRSPYNNASIALNTLDGNGQKYVIAATSNNNNNGQGFVIKDLTNNSARLKINSNGNIGIGTLDPSEKLEVDGNILIKDNNALILSSPNGTKFKITVDDNGNLTTSPITAIQSVKLDGEIKIFPNPTDNQLTIEINQQDILQIDAEIYTLTGKMIYMKSFHSNSFQITTSDLSVGAYILKLKDFNGNLIKEDKFIKQ